MTSLSTWQSARALALRCKPSTLTLCAVCGTAWLLAACGGSNPEDAPATNSDFHGESAENGAADEGASGAVGAHAGADAGDAATGKPIAPDSGKGGSSGSAGSGSGGGTADPGSVGGWGGDTGDLIAESPEKCQKPIVPGWNEDWEANGMKRAFFADFPSKTSVAPAVVFSFHGFGDNPASYRQALDLDPDTDPGFPMIVVTPESTHLQPFNLGNVPQGLDWDLANGGHEYENRDVLLVQSILGCLRKQNGADVNRVYSVGFSAGSVFSALLHSRFQHDFAAIVALSGMWFNDPAELAIINPLLPLNLAWDDLDPQFGGNVLLSHGGASDKIGIAGLPIVSIEEAASAAFPFLGAAGRAVVDCPHDGGHRLPPELSPSHIVGFLKAHQRGKPSPYLANGLDPALGSACSLRDPQ